jgi:hypothetical protein
MVVEVKLSLKCGMASLWYVRAKLKADAADVPKV